MGNLLNKTSSRRKKTLIAYLMIIIVLFVWGASPPIDNFMNQKYSVALRVAVVGFIASITLLIICAKKLKKLNRDYFKIAVPTGVFLSLASLVQKIGLLYTTPTKYAFLENLSCVVVPIILFVVMRKKPNVLTVIACVLCLIGSFVLSGMKLNGDSLSFGLGELLCGLAGILYGVNIAFTGVHIKKFDTTLYLLVQLMTSAVVGMLSAILLSVIKVDGVPIEPLHFSWDIGGLLLLLVLALLSNVLCWFLRTSAMRYVNPTAISVIMPFSAVITGVISVLLGMEQVSNELLIGGGIALLAGILSSVADVLYEKKN